MASTVPRRPTLDPPGLHRREWALVVLEGLLAVSAAGGAWGLIAGSLDSTAFERRLPFHSAVLGGVALALVVAVPAVVALVATVGRRSWAPTAGVVAGGLLVGWIVVQVAIIGATSLLQPLMFVWGSALVVLGALEGRARGRG